MKQILNRLTLLREEMKKNDISACVVPATDPHASEYIADCWKEREFISGFNGSAGTAVITLQSAALWTDSRYFLQAENQLADTSYTLMKQGLPETPDINAWLAENLQAGEKVAVNTQMFSHNAFEAMKKELKQSYISLTHNDLISKIWTDRPLLPKNQFFVYDTKFAGQTAREKLQNLRSEIKKLHADTIVISALDEIAWLFNIRGNDVNFNPVVVAYALVEQGKATLFVLPEKLTVETKKHLENEGVTVKKYLEIYTELQNISPEKTVFLDGAKINQSLYEAIPATCEKLNQMSPIFKMKSLKNATEVLGIHQAMLKDGVALTKFFKWLEENAGKTELSELSISQKLHDCRAEQENFVGESFATIAGYAAHGAIVHYSATLESNLQITNANILLLDSGGQYLEGTTDITRTIALGEPTPQQKTDNTLVLKGHIAIATANFPVGTRGSQLDILARKALWDRNLNYGHGTGHGVGHFLCVHEGPQNIRMEENPATLLIGMITSNEPGIYRAGEYGIRIENLTQVVAAEQTEFGQFLRFETLTLFPIDTKLIDVDLLEQSEIDWLNNYHTIVYEKLSPHLNENEKLWLKGKCKKM